MVPRYGEKMFEKDKIVPFTDKYDIEKIYKPYSNTRRKTKKTRPPFSENSFTDPLIPKQRLPAGCKNLHQCIRKGLILPIPPAPLEGKNEV